jgi:hypothetical protein
MARRWILRSVALVALLTVAGAPASSASEMIHCRITVRTISDGDELRLTYALRSPVRRRDYVVKLFVDGNRVYQKALETNAVGRVRAVAFAEDPAGRTAIRGTGRDSVTGVVCAADVLVPER